MKCPNCGTESSGTFCAECGTPLKGAKCRSCSAVLPVGSKFCTQCGASVRGGAAGTSKTAWYIVGGALALLLIVLIWPTISSDKGNPANDGRVPIGQLQDGTSGGAQGPLSGTPREQADRLFNRVMSERESGDTARARFFLPMAIQAYGGVGDLDPDGLYHLSLLHNLNEDYDAALATAEGILSTSPNHLLALSAAANAARGKGDTAAARKYYERFLSAYETESPQPRQEYQDHARMLPELRAEAQSFVR
jgi:hypothetical protein